MLAGRFALLALLALLVPVSRAHAQSCTDDADCPAGTACDLAPQATPTCARDGECPEPEPDPTPEGRCEAQPVACEDDADCPTGLNCVDEGRGGSDVTCASSPDGGTDCEDAPEPEPATRACGFVWTECETDADCEQPGYACIVAGEQSASECSVAVPACMPGADCPEPAEPECEPIEEVSRCFPARTDCDDDADCEAGWECYALPEDVIEDAPPGFEGATQVCFPEGLVLVIEDKIQLADGDSGGVSASDSGGGGESVSEQRDLSGAASDGDDGDSSSGGGESGPESEAASDDGGCSVADVVPRGASSAASVLLLGAALSLVRRRHAR